MWHRRSSVNKSQNQGNENRKLDSFTVQGSGKFPVFTGYVTWRTEQWSRTCFPGWRAGRGLVCFVFTCFLCPVMCRKLAERFFSLLLLLITQSLHPIAAFRKATVQLNCLIAIVFGWNTVQPWEAQDSPRWLSSKFSENVPKLAWATQNSQRPLYCFNAEN